MKVYRGGKSFIVILSWYLRYGLLPILGNESIVLLLLRTFLPLKIELINIRRFTQPLNVNSKLRTATLTTQPSVFLSEDFHQIDLWSQLENPNLASCLKYYYLHSRFYNLIIINIFWGILYPASIVVPLFKLYLQRTKPCLISNRIRLHFPCGDLDKTRSQYISLDENIINIRALRGISNNTIYSGGNGFVENVTTEEIIFHDRK